MRRPTTTASRPWFGAGVALGLVLTASSAPAQTTGTATPAQPRPQTAAPAGDAAKGRTIYMTYYCQACHGTDGQGGAGVRIAPNPAAFTYFRNYLRKPAGTMPPYLSKALPDAEIADIYAYLRTIPASTPATSIPLLQP